jgi:two-component system, cell cycle sensor histidine kinase and response regulator CckA
VGFEPEKGPPLPVNPKTVLVAEDHEFVRQIMGMLLERFGYTVITTPDAETALEVCRSHQKPIELALLDIALPRMSGIELGDCLRDLLPCTRILFMTGYTPHELVGLGIDVRDTKLVRKPFTARDLIQQVGTALAGDSKTAARS